MAALRKPDKKSFFLLAIFMTGVALLACGYLFWGLTERNTAFFLPRRLIKVAAILLVSISVGYTSTVFQTITNNNILTPSVMGFDSMYVFVQTVIMFFFGAGNQLMDSYSEFLLCVGIMMLFSGVLFLTLLRKNASNIFLLVLAGMVLGSLFSSFTVFFQVLLDPNEYMALQGKMFAGFENINSSLLTISAIIVAACTVISVFDFKKLDVAALGSDAATNLGVSYASLSLKVMLITAVLVSVSTALVGPITFLGILVVSLARKLIPSYKHAFKVPAAILIGLCAMLGGLILMERVFAYQVTISMLINFVGGLYFIYLLIREGGLKKKR